MQVLTAEAIVDRLSRVVREPDVQARGAAVAFDGDGTLWSGDVGEDFFFSTLELGRFLPATVEAMRAVGRRLGLAGMEPGYGTGVAVARRLFDAYLEHKLPEELICEVIAWTCAGWCEEDVVALSRAVVAGGGLEARRRTELRAVVEWARRSGVLALLVSASPRPVVEAAGAGWGFDREHILAATARFEGGVMLPEVVRPIPYGPGKVKHLEERMGGRVLIGAFGDNVFDVPMLEAARVPVVVEPKPRLLAKIEEGVGFEPVMLETPST